MKEHLRRAKIKHYHNTHERQITRGDEYVAADKSFGVWIEIKNGGMPMNDCPRCGGTDTVLVGAFNPGDSDDTTKCLDCEKEYA